MIYGYARVSTGGQSVAAQVKDLRAAGTEKVFRETASGAKTDRLQLRRALAQPEADDVLVVTRLDRLARSTRDLLNTLAAIADKGATFRSLGAHQEQKSFFSNHLHPSLTLLFHRLRVQLLSGFASGQTLGDD